MTWHPTTLRGRLVAWYTGILTAMAVLLGATELFLLDHGLRKNVDDSLHSVARVIANSSQSRSFFGPDFEDSLQSMLGPELAERFFQLLDPRGRIDPRWTTPRRSGLPLSAQALHNAERGQPTLETIKADPRSDKTLRLLTMPVFKAGVLVNIVQVAMSLENVKATRASFLLVLLILAPVALGASALGGYFLARRALAPVDAIVEAARRIEAEDLTQRVPLGASDDELRRLANVINDMLARLERSFGAARRFSSDAAHELRTPLTIIKGEIELALSSSGEGSAEIRRALKSCLEEVDRLNALMDDLLLLARLEANALNGGPAPVDVAQLFEDATPALRELAAKAGQSCAIHAVSSAWVRGYEALLFRLIFNLVENAVKYTPRGGRIEVSLGLEDGAAILAVTDSGPGIPPEIQEQVFERFYRGDPAREGGGTGLGLALVKSIVQFHHGEITLKSAPGQGSTFAVRLPRTEAPASS
jgi:heavy metal sensor kinase